MSIEQAYWAMIGIGAVTALFLAGCCLLVGLLLPRPERHGFEVRDKR